MIELRSFRTEGLGDSTYLVTFDGLGILVDPQRDYDRFLTALGGAQLRWVLETHLHNDYVSGGLAAAKETGAAQHYRDAKITQIYEGTNQVQRLVMGRKLLS